MRHLILFSLFLMCSAAQAENFPWSKAKAEPEVKSGILDIEVTTTFCRDTRSPEERKAFVEKEVKRIKKECANMKSEEKEHIITHFRNDMEERAQKDHVEGYRAKFVFSGDNFKIEPEVPEPTFGKHDCYYKFKNTLIQYQVHTQSIIIRTAYTRWMKRCELDYQDLRMDFWMNPKNYFSQMENNINSGMPYTITNTSKNETVVQISTEKGASENLRWSYYLDPQLHYSIRSYVNESPDVPTNISKTDYLDYSTHAPYVPSAIVHTFQPPDWPPVLRKNVLLKAEWNYVIPDSEFAPKDLPLVTVQDERFSPQLYYKAKGTLPSDKELATFVNHPEEAAKHDQALETKGP